MVPDMPLRAMHQLGRDFAELGAFAPRDEPVRKLARVKALPVVLRVRNTEASWSELVVLDYPGKRENVGLER